MKVVYFGSATFAVPALRALAPHISLVVSQPPKPTGRKLVLTKTPVHLVAEELGLPVETPPKCRAPEFIEQLREKDADVFIVAAYGQILPQALLDVPRQGCFNLHGSVLPRWRGAAPVQRAVEAGDNESGVTLMAMDAGMDTGDILAIERTPISSDETAGELYDRLAEIAGEMASEWLPRLVAGDFERQKQDDDSATHAKKVVPAEGQITSNLPAKTAYDRYRGFSPTPGCWLATSSGPLKIKKASLSPAVSEPGTVVATRPDLVVALTDGSLVIEIVQPAGKPPMSGKDYANGARLQPGFRLID